APSTYDSLHEARCAVAGGTTAAARSWTGGIECISPGGRENSRSCFSVADIYWVSQIIMTTESQPTVPAFGSDDLRLPDELRAPIKRHLTTLRQRYGE